MNIIQGIGTAILQLLFGYILGFGITVVAGAGNGWELATIALGSVLGVWGVGIISARIQQFALSSGEIVTKLVATLIGAGLGVAVILAIGKVGFVGGFLLPVVGAALGYYVLPRLVRQIRRSQA